MWIGTENGLYRLEGQESKLMFSVPGSTTDTIITALSQDDENNIWIGTTNQGLFRLDPASGNYTPFKSEPNDDENLPSDRITHIYYDRSHRLWVSTADQGLCQFHLQTGKFSHYEPNAPPARRLPSLRIGPVIEDKAGNLFIGSRDMGLFCLPSNRQEVLQISSPVSDLTIQALFVDPSDTIWVGTIGSGLFSLTGPMSPEKSLTKVTYAQPNPYFGGQPKKQDILALHESSLLPNSLWIGTPDGLLLLDRLQGKSSHALHTDQKDSISSNQILSFMEDANGTLWIGTEAGKFNRINLRQHFFKTYLQAYEPGSLIHNQISSLCWYNKEQTHLLLGGQDGSIQLGKSSLDRSSYEFSPLGPSFPSAISQMIVLPSGQILILTKNHGLWKCSADLSNRLLLTANGLTGPSDQPDCMMLSPASALIFLGGTSGLSLFDPADPSHLKPFAQTRSLSITSIHSDGKTGLLLATRSGLYHLSDQSINTRPILLGYANEETDLADAAKGSPIAKEKAVEPEITCIFKRQNGQILLGSRKHGILTPKGTSIGPLSSSQKPGQFPISAVKGFSEDNLLRLWVCFEDGLFLQLATDTAFDNWIFFGDFHHLPLPLSGPALFDNPSGNLLFASAQGLLQINSRQLILPLPASTILRKLQAINPITRQQLNLTNTYPQNIRIPSTYSTLEATLAVQDYLAPEQNRLSYRLFGRDSQWRISATGEQTIIYQRLSTGSYTLHVSGINSYMQRSRQGLIISLEFYVPLLKQPWFWILLFVGLLLLSGTIGLLWHYRRHHLPDDPLPQETQPINEACLDSWVHKHNISERERQIIELIMAGKSNKEIEETLFISIKTVKSHVYNVYKKANVKSRYELITLFNHREQPAPEQESSSITNKP